MSNQFHIAINDPEQAEPEALEMAVRAALRWAAGSDVKGAEIHTAPRTEAGWLEYTVLIHMEGGRNYHIAVIQREPGAQFECHS